MRQALRWAASIALLGLALALLDWPSLANSTQKITPGMFVVAVLLACLPSLPLIARWHALTAAESGWYGSSARYLYANLLNSVSPGNIGGDVYRFFAFRSAERNGAALVALLVRERLLGLASMLTGLLTGALAMQVTSAHPQQWLVRSMALGAAVGLAALMLLSPIVERVPVPEPWRAHLRAALAIRTFARDAALLGWSLAALALWLVAVHFVATRLGLEIPWAVLLVVVTTVELVRVIPVTIQGIGLREAAFATLCGAFGYAHETGFVVGAVAYLALSGAQVATGAVGALMLAFKAPPP
jgi:glycosyltransferase 2 family protein